MTEVQVVAENIVKLEREIKEEPEEESFEDTFGNEIYLNLDTVDAGNCGLSPIEDELDEEIKPPLAIFLEFNVENQEEEEECKAVECEQDPLFVGVDNVSIKEENILDSVKEDAVSDLDVGDIGDADQLEGNASIPETVHCNEPIGTQTKAKSSCSKESFPERAERVRNILDDSEGSTTRDAPCQRFFAAEAHISDHTYAMSAEKLCQCDLCRMSFEPKPLLCGSCNEGKSNPRTPVKRKRRKSVGKVTAANTTRNVRSTTKFICRICNTRFISKIQLSGHMLDHNPNEKNPNTKRPRKDVCDRIPQTVVMQFSCEICGLMFSRRGNLTRHILVHNNVSNNDDDDSKELSNIRKKLKTLVNKDLGNCIAKKRPFMCPICRKIIKSKLGLSRHMLVHLSLSKERSKKDTNENNISQKVEKQFLCEICNLRFRYKRYLTQHMLTHQDKEEENNKSNGCGFNKRKSRNICRTKAIAEQKLHHMNISYRDCDKEKNIFNKTLLNKGAEKHLGLRTTQDAFYCGICKSTFKLKMCLSRHINLYNKKQKTNECDINNKTTLKKSVAFIHLHSEEKPYGCNICKITFDTIAHLSSHMHVHPKQTFSDLISRQNFCTTETRSEQTSSHNKETYECGVCKQIFDSNEQLSQHLPTHKTTYKSAFPKNHLDAKDFSRHVSLHKKIEYYCKVCKHTFDSNEELSKHSSLHTKNSYYCNICKETFDSNLQKTSEHLSMHKKYYCAPCKTSFYGIQNHYRHQRMHRKANNVCLHCKKTFYTPDQLSLHMRIHEWRRMK